MQIRCSMLEIYQNIMWSHSFIQLRICRYALLNSFRIIGSVSD
ncbi:hypothetical protein HKBW3S43_02083, partial [Candidatus Hakubella thermalkaliphila]